VKKGAGKFCSRQCSDKGKTRTKYKPPIKIKCVICLNEYEVKNYRKDISKTCSNKCRQELFRRTSIGENAPNWRGGISKQRDIDKRTKEYKEWRSQVYERDNYTCISCRDNSGGNLHAHHIENYSSSIELRLNINNGITLCNNCHNPAIKGSFHNIYGTKNNNKLQLDEFIKEPDNG
jgi:5-methylcytosine-specific restriction endonuclease McrA